MRRWDDEIEFLRITDFCPTLFLHHLPEIVDDIGETVGVDDQSNRLAQNNNRHVAFEGHIGQTS